MRGKSDNNVRNSICHCSWFLCDHGWLYEGVYYRLWARPKPRRSVLRLEGILISSSGRTLQACLYLFVPRGFSNLQEQRRRRHWYRYTIHEAASCSKYVNHNKITKDDDPNIRGSVDKGPCLSLCPTVTLIISRKSCPFHFNFFLTLWGCWTLHCSIHYSSIPCILGSPPQCSSGTRNLK